MDLSNIAVLAIGGAHQFPHIVPVACELERRQPGQVTVYVNSASDAEAVRDLAKAIGLPAPLISEMTLPRWAEAMVPHQVDKITRLLTWAPRITRADAILCAERTTTILRRLFPQCPPLLHIPHGAGDRAVGFEPRFKLFDHVMVAGDKDRDRLIAAGYVTPERCRVTGPVKLAAMIRKGQKNIKHNRPPLFDNNRPTILYNPHFSAKLGSFEPFARRLIEAVSAQDRYNLIVAPHVRMTANWDAAKRAKWLALEKPGQVKIDLGSAACLDMTYTLGADLYVGDVSSQVYEFLAQPRPCLFVDAHHAAWQDNEDYAMWAFGPVIAPDADPVAAIEHAFDTHESYAAAQRGRVRYAMGGIDWLPDGTITLANGDPIAVAADDVEQILATHEATSRAKAGKRRKAALAGT